jgi:GTP pyrophosphokinase
MLRDYSDHFFQVPVALRIVFDAKKDSEDEDVELTCARERALCYYARELCMNRRKPLPGNPRFKDYVERPKANGYQSLHYTAITNWGGEDWTMEFQIRSGEMHQVAEYGLASHWEYKAKSNGQEDERIQNDSSDAYLKSVQD